MTRRKLLALALLAAAHGFPERRPAPPKPKLVVAIVIDQFRYDYLTRFRADYNGGIAALLDHGAVFTNASYRQFPTVTAVGHSIILSGAMPALSGIIDNEWFDRGLNRNVTSVSDDAAQLVGARILSFVRQQQATRLAANCPPHVVAEVPAQSSLP